LWEERDRGPILELTEDLEPEKKKKAQFPALSFKIHKIALKLGG
jgi:hypothetical protein